MSNVCVTGFYFGGRFIKQLMGSSKVTRHGKKPAPHGVSVIRLKFEPAVLLCHILCGQRFRLGNSMKLAVSCRMFD